jgi:adenylate kinase family enzyme
MNDPRFSALPDRKTALLLLGPTGSGKTPLGDWIARGGLWGLRFVHFDFGESLRRAVEADRAGGLLRAEEIEFLREVLQSGALLENEHFSIAEKILRGFLAEQGTDRRASLVLNGLPRHAGQAESLGSIVDVQTVVCLSCAGETVLARLRSDTGGDRGQRVDDDLDSVLRKLAIYARRTTPLVDHYRACGARIETIEVTATMTAEEAWRILEGRGKA